MRSACALDTSNRSCCHQIVATWWGVTPLSSPVTATTGRPFFSPKTCPNFFRLASSDLYLVASLSVKGKCGTLHAIVEPLASHFALALAVEHSSFHAITSPLDTLCSFTDSLA